MKSGIHSVLAPQLSGHINFTPPDARAIFFIVTCYVSTMWGTVDPKTGSIDCKEKCYKIPQDSHKCRNLIGPTQQNVCTVTKCKIGLKRVLTRQNSTSNIKVN